MAEKKQYNWYRLRCTVRFSVDDKVSDSPENAKEMSREDIADNVEVAVRSGNYELLEVEAEELGPVNEEDLRDMGYE